MHKDHHIWEKLAAYFASHPSQKDEKELEEWLKSASGDERRLFKEAQLLWEKSAPDSVDFDPDLSKGLDRFRLKVSMRQAASRKIPYARLAAVIALLILFSFLFFQNLDQPQELIVSASEEVKEINLPDGSQVWLNKNATLAYSEDFNVENRMVRLEGEAFFEVKKAEGRRFTIFTETTRTEVIGTSFNMIATPGKPVKIQVATGKVAFSSIKGNQTVFLEPGQEAIYEKDAEVSKVTTQKIEDPNFRSWQNKRLEFNNTSLEQLTQTLEEYFQTTIILDEDLTDCRVTASFKDPQIEDVIEVLEMTGNFKISKTQTGYSLTGEKCK